MMNEEIEPHITDKRMYNLVYDFPFTFRHKCVYTQLSQHDLIRIMRQVKDKDLKKQLAKLITLVDEHSIYKTDLKNQKVDRTKLLKEKDREVNSFDELKINKTIQNDW